MDFFGIGMGEVILILLIVLMVFGPGKLPEVARGLGKAVHEFRKYSSALTRDFREEFEKEVREPPEETESRQKSGGETAKHETSPPKEEGTES